MVEIVYRYGSGAGSTRERPADSWAALSRLNGGNRDFASLVNSLAENGRSGQRIIDIDAAELGLGAAGPQAPAQRPFAAILSCADARVPVELIFNEGPNDLFVVRVAGSVLGSEVLGSIGYAVEHLRGSLKVVAVLGHSGCGAMTAAVDVFLSPHRYLSLAADHALRGLVDRMLVVVQASAKRLAETFGPDIAARSGYREALIESSITVNAALSAYTLQQEIARSGNSDLRAVFGVYLLDARRVWVPRPGGGEPYGLAEPPRDEASFFDLGTAILESERVGGLLR